jgi:NTE family protein
MTTRARCFAFLVLAGLAACSTDSMNQPVTQFVAADDDRQWIANGGYRQTTLAGNGSSDQLLVLMASSGGGKRSAAFSYGVLRGLRDLPITVDGRERRLLDELDTIAAVSGGSFPAAYYGLHRDKIFTDFEADFLKRDIEAYIWGIYLLPWNWEWWLNPLHGTNDEMGNVYDELMFHGATYADLLKQGKPLISINATDINYGTVFPFTQDHFDLICSDLSSYPVARAVAASNGFPVLFTPITLENHAAKCGGRAPQWIKQASGSKDLTRQRYLAEFAQLYLDPVQTQYVHLMDGGISDNLAMRQMVNNVLIYADDAELIRRLGFDRVRRIVLISADGQASRDSTWPQQRTVTSLGQIFSAVSGTQIDSYNFETLLLVKEQLERLVESLRRVRCEEGPIVDGYPCDDVQGYFAHLSLTDIPDPKVRTELQQIPTGLTIPDDAVDKLVEMGEAVVRDSEALAEFRRSLQPSGTQILGNNP